ncbi:MAG: putative RDD family membrane protein YckC [Akkermansiaceae bacterium]|jgi:uncharacterized RDD family membrane protein YckC
MDIKNPRILKLKGLLFLFLGFLSAGILYLIAPDWKVMALLAISSWSFARFYYFAFYVLEHYADPNFRYAGLWDLLKYLLRGERK